MDDKLKDSFKKIIDGIRDLVFFFQAEDGIRDLYVTGVQTCALPISLELGRPTCSWRRSAMERLEAVGRPYRVLYSSSNARSEEHTSELQSRRDLVCRLLLEKKKKKKKTKR